LRKKGLTKSGNIGKQRIGAAAGILAPILAFTCILTAIASHPGFSWANNALSDLGIIPGITGPLFNFGIYASGLLAFSFAIFGLLSYIGKKWVGKIGVALFGAATIALIAIGIFNESYSGTHFAVSVAFFVLMPISMFMVTCAFLISRQGPMAIFTLLIGIASALPWVSLFAFHYVQGVAIPEFISGVAISAWTIMLSYKILKKIGN